ncbi:hypothetical protein [Nocardia tengchongensis]
MSGSVPTPSPDFGIDARLITVDLQEYLTDPHSRAFVMGDDDLDIFHAGHYLADVRPIWERYGPLIFRRAALADLHSAPCGSSAHSSPCERS